MKNLTIKTQRAMYFPASWQFANAISDYVTRNCTLGQCAGIDARIEADAYLMGGEL